MSDIALPEIKSSPDEKDDFVDAMEGMKPGEMPMPEEEGIQQQPSLITRLLIKLPQ